MEEKNQQQEVRQPKFANPLKGLFNYGWITRNIPFFLFLALLAVIYIANGHMADKTIRDINRTAREVKELQYEYKTLKSEVMFRSREAELVKAAEPLGLKLSTEPPVRIVLEKRE
ncbi:FtsL-like putative cell division protein [Foetidibacter luteolus]|uniref:FtsL-like putative cell division protein n=1 Tax=Foetidibacter luteolus TaxID=2608880 RepID=UPI001F20311E|nr:FtsL-like putative cell division protein [Foetidibacter luteolus]